MERVAQREYFMTTIWSSRVFVSFPRVYYYHLSFTINSSPCALIVIWSQAKMSWMCWNCIVELVAFITNKNFQF